MHVAFVEAERYFASQEILGESLGENYHEMLMGCSE